MTGYYRRAVEANKWRRCDVDGCAKMRSAAARFCLTHRLREARYGSPTGCAITKRQLDPYRKLARQFLKANSAHPAIVTVCAELDRRLADAVAYVEARTVSAGEGWKPAQKDVAGKLAVELKRLRDEGATGSDLLCSALTMHLLSHFVQSIEHATPAYEFAIARAVLLTRPLASHLTDTRVTGKAPRRVQDRLSTRVLRDLGKSLSVSLCVILHGITKAIEEQRSKPQPSRAERLAQAIERQPFAVPA